MYPKRLTAIGRNLGEGAMKERGLSEQWLINLAAYLAETRFVGPVEILDLKKHTEGWSRTTISFTADDGSTEERIVVRIETEALLSPSSHGIEYEYEVMKAMEETDVPCPMMYDLESDRKILGEKFFLAEFINGETPNVWRSHWRERLQGEWATEGRPLPNQFVDILVDLHSIDTDRIDVLDDPGADDVAANELAEYEEWYGSTKRTNPVLEEAFRWLESNMPMVSERTFVHGDYRVGNMLLDDSRVEGLLDWELARISDPMYDLGFTSTRYLNGRLTNPADQPEYVNSLLPKQWFFEEYARRAGREIDFDRVRYWQIFSLTQHLCHILLAIDRYADGDSADVRNAWLQYMIPAIMTELLEYLESDRTIDPS